MTHSVRARKGRLQPAADDDIGTRPGAVRFLIEGRNCWRRVRASRLAFLIDAQSYFSCFKAAALRARTSIMIVGWDVNSRMPLEFPDDARHDVPNKLGPFLNYLANTRPGLKIRVLDWDSPLFFAPDREWAQQAHFDWFTHPNMRFALDDQHPLGGSHHQKLVVIDDDIAFVGGIDLTDSRLDGPEHRACDPRRRKPDGDPYGPHHDVQVAVSGCAAKALASVAYDRWRCATGEHVQSALASEDCWPEDLAVDLVDTDVAIARTYPAWKHRPDIREIETLFLDAIARAERTVYIENQYFCADRVAQAIIERLADADCPEFVLIVPSKPGSWLERKAMGSKQQRLLAHVRRADHRGRFRVYMPVVGERGEVSVKVHSKVLIVDDRIAIIGSANLNNRSLGLDSECNLALEGDPGSATERAVTALRDRLLSEHLGLPEGVLAAEIDTQGSLIDAIERLRGEARSLRPFPQTPADLLDTIAADLDVLDPDAPAAPERIADELAQGRQYQTTLRAALVRLAAVIVVFSALAALWRWGPLSSWADPAVLDAWGHSLSSSGMATALLLVAYVVGSLLMFPVLVLIAATGLFYGPVSGVLIAGAGSLLSAGAGYAVGALLGRRFLRRMAGGRLDHISRRLARRGVLSMTVIRLLPVAPFTLINLAAGASHIRFRDYLVGTTLGMAPGIVAITAFSGQLRRVIDSPDATNIAVLAGVMIVIIVAAFLCWRRFVRSPSYDATSK